MSPSRIVRLPLVTLLLVSSLARAGHVDIDLTEERHEYETKNARRNLGLGFLVATLVVSGASAFFWSDASSTRSTLLAQTTPVDVATRQSLVNQGQLSNGAALVGTLIGISLAIFTFIFLSKSF